MQNHTLTLDVTDFRGLKGPHHYSFDKFNVLIAPNGSGKSSVMDALKFALTGNEPDGDMIYSGADRCSVRVTFPSGASFERIKFRGTRASKYLSNGKSSTLAKMNADIQSELGGVKVGNARMIAMGEALSSIDSKQFGELVLSYMPESMTADDVLQVLSRRDPYIDARVKEELPDGEFGVEAIDRFYSVCMERKKILRAKIREFEAVIRTREGAPEVKESEEALRGKIIEQTGLRDRQLVLSQKKAEYERAVAAQKRFDDNVVRLENEISSITANAHPEQERTSAVLVLEAHRATITASFSALKNAEMNERTLNDAIRNISQPVCPLSEKLVCSTDKTKVIGDMTSSLIQVQKQKEFQRNQYENARKKAAEMEKTIRGIDADNAAAQRKTFLVHQLEELRRTKPTIPEPPEEPLDIRRIDAELERLRHTLTLLKTNEQTGLYIKKRDEYEFKAQRYEYLAQAFSPKGEVKGSITEMYLKEFEEPCNAKAKKIFHRMSIRFAAENGVTVYCDPEGLGRYVPFDSLSAGEKAAVTFTIVVTLADISGFRIVLMDEMSVLDGDVFGKLLDAAKEADDEYDMMLVACVEHDDTRRHLEKEGVNLVGVDGA